MKLLLYCTKSKTRLFFDKLKEIFTLGKIPSNNDLNGKIVAECDYEVEKVFYTSRDCWYRGYRGENTTNVSLCKKSCLLFDELNDYLQGKNGYAIRIENLKIFNTPEKLNTYIDKNKNYILKAPQSMMYCREPFNEEKYVLISIQPQWLCKILNGEKTIEVRRKVLKEMIKK